MGVGARTAGAEGHQNNPRPLAKGTRMHASPHSFRRAGLWLGTLVVLTAVTVSGRGAPQDRGQPGGEPANKAGGLADKKVEFKFANRPWRDVLNWLSEQTGLPLISTNVPT